MLDATTKTIKRNEDATDKYSYKAIWHVPTKQTNKQTNKQT